MIQSAWLEASEYLSRGMSFDLFDEGIASIKTQGHGGSFLMDDLTLELLRSEEFLSSPLFDMTGGYESSQSILEKALRRVSQITADYTSPVPGATQEAIRRYFHDKFLRI